MIGRLLAKWRMRTRLQQVDAYFRWTLYLLPWLEALGCVQPVAAAAAAGDPLLLALAVTALALCVTQALVMIKVFRHALRHYLERGPAPVRMLIVSVLVAFAVEATLFWLMYLTAQAKGGGLASAALAALAAVTPPCMGYSLVVSKRRFMATTGLVGAGLVLLIGLLTQSWGWGLFLAAYLVGAGLWSFVIARPSGWILAVFWELDAARATQARLAVAEERLRFGRDLHDVMGRNLAVIALKSELAVQLARRERPEAVDQMVEVQRVAQESQREVREVVRGYRKADLQAELAGARSILLAAGVDCRIEGTAGGRLPSAAQAALGWVVREGTTNVLRHATDVRRCTIRNDIDARRSVLVLTMENDGVGAPLGAVPQPASGNGLKGLRERLQPLGGRLTAGSAPGGFYRLTVELPIEAGGGDPVGVGGGGADGVSDG
ncbi:sensor histidine kinase [Streptomyces sp. NPDC048650]|uniref:sensor histidine kinase n=1 Tax=Streptomyces sp. NPDC048650 TaxID=3365583 RepID=UPI003719D40B